MHLKDFDFFQQFFRRLWSSERDRFLIQKIIFYIIFYINNNEYFSCFMITTKFHHHIDIKIISTIFQYTNRNFHCSKLFNFISFFAVVLRIPELEQKPQKLESVKLLFHRRPIRMEFFPVFLQRNYKGHHHNNLLLLPHHRKGSD